MSLKGYGSQHRYIYVISQHLNEMQQLSTLLNTQHDDEDLPQLLRFVDMVPGREYTMTVEREGEDAMRFTIYINWTPGRALLNWFWNNWTYQNLDIPELGNTDPKISRTAKTLPIPYTYDGVDDNGRVTVGRARRRDIPVHHGLHHKVSSQRNWATSVDENVGRTTHLGNVTVHTEMVSKQTSDQTKRLVKNNLCSIYQFLALNACRDVVGKVWVMIIDQTRLTDGGRAGPYDFCEYQVIPTLKERASEVHVVCRKLNSALEPPEGPDLDENDAQLLGQGSYRAEYEGNIDLPLYWMSTHKVVLEPRRTQYQCHGRVYNIADVTTDALLDEDDSDPDVPTGIGRRDRHSCFENPAIEE